MELDFSLLSIDLLDGGDALVKLRVQPAKQDPRRGSLASFVMSLFVLIDEPSPGRSAGVNLQAIAAEALAQARLLVHPASAERYLQKVQAKEQERDMQSQIRGLGTP